MVEYEYIHCSFSFRLLAILYDSILLSAVLFFATAVLTLVIDTAVIQQSRFFYPVYLLACCYLYFVWHWVQGGQTLGMKAWRVSIVTQAARPGWHDATIRFFLALFSIPLLGAGLLWSLFDREHLTFYERYSNTRLVRERKSAPDKVEKSG